MEAVRGHKMLPGWRQRGTLMTGTGSLPQDAASQPHGVIDESETNIELLFFFNHFSFSFAWRLHQVKLFRLCCLADLHGKRAFYVSA